ncbi:OmpA family protein [Nocardiopsis algeriensis]|uniref:OmpA family protein n=1 Tax=Nocardiopsis algeriensis TaxID=1478215 RepID=UPI003B43B6D7
MSHVGKLSAALITAAVLAGVPYLLLWHLPWPELPQSWDVAAAHLRGLRLPPGVPAALLIVALWTLWGLYTAGLAVEVAARLRGAPRRLRPLGPLQAVAAAAVGTAALTPAGAFADTVADGQEEHGNRQERAGDEDGGNGEEGMPPASGEAARPTERVRTVAGFAVGSAELTEQMRQDLAPVAEMIASYGDPGAPVRITGHTDPSGSATANMDLSERRAQAVADHLADTLGEDAPDFEVRGAGSGEPRDGGAAAQRRAEVSYTVVPQQPPPAVVHTREAAAVEEIASEAPADDGDRRVVVLEIPEGTVTGALAFAGLAGGYVLGRRGARVPRISLSLPRMRSLPRSRPRRLALPAPPPRPVPEDEIDERVTVELDHVPGLGVTGEGAFGAVRRLVANALDPLDGSAVRVLITEADTVRLLGEKARDLLRAHPCEPVRMVDTMEEALEVLQRELHGDTGERPPLALVASAPGPEHETALSGLLLHGQRNGITAVILGRWPLGGSLVIEADGLITQTSPPLNPLFHCSWPGSTADQVVSAVRAYRHSSPAGPDQPRASAPAPAAEPENPWKFLDEPLAPAGTTGTEDLWSFLDAESPAPDPAPKPAAASGPVPAPAPVEAFRPTEDPGVMKTPEPTEESRAGGFGETRGAGDPARPGGTEKTPDPTGTSGAAEAPEPVADPRPAGTPETGKIPEAAQTPRTAGTSGSSGAPGSEGGAEATGQRGEPAQGPGTAQAPGEAETSVLRSLQEALAPSPRRKPGKAGPRGGPAEAPGDGGRSPAPPAAGTAPTGPRQEPQPARPRQEPEPARPRPRTVPAEPRIASRTERLERLERLGRAQPSAGQGAAAAPAAEPAADPQPARPLPRKPKKAGRGRSWRPK